MAKGSKENRNENVLTKEEITAMRETLEERRSGNSEGESAILAKIAEMPEPDRTMAERVHAIIRANAPMLTMRPWIRNIIDKGNLHADQRAATYYLLQEMLINSRFAQTQI